MTDGMPALRSLAANGLCAMIAAAVVGSVMPAFGADGVLELPERLRDEREIEDLKRERQKEEIRNQVEALRGLQTDELETKHDQLKRLKDMLQLDREVREGLRTSPELETIYRGIFQSGPGEPNCDCLDRVTLQLVSRAQVGVAVLSLDGLSRNYRQGESVGNTACRVGVVAEDDVAVQCGTGRCLLSLGRKECNGP